LKRNTFQDCSVLAIFGDDVHDAGHLREPLGCLIQVAIGKLLFTRLVSMLEEKTFFFVTDDKGVCHWQAFPA
jgi:hypothetical protein